MTGREHIKSQACLLLVIAGVHVRFVKSLYLKNLNE